MDSIQFHHIKLEKSRKVANFASIRTFTSLFRLIELLLLLVLVSKLYFRIPVAVKFSGAALREAAVFLVSPRFVFIIGNAIVITLFAKSGRDPGRDSSNTTAMVDAYQELIKKRSETARHEIGKREEERRLVAERICRSIQSEKSLEACGGKLKRYESDKYLRICDSDKKMAKHSYPEDGMSSEEFRNKIEAFIARQKRFQKDEEQHSVNLVSLHR